MFALIRAWLRSARAKSSIKVDDEEAAPLLEGQENDQTEAYGSTDAIKTDASGNGHMNADDKSTSKEDSPAEGKRKQDIHWLTYLRQFAIFIPYIWPSRNVRLQLHLVGIFICLVVIRMLNVLAPRQLGIVINSFGTSPGYMPVSELILYLFLDWLVSSAILRSIKDYLWLPVEQNAHKAIVTATFDHIMGLSCDFHDNKKSGELYRSMAQGRSIYMLFESTLFDLLPMLVDLVVACVYLSYLFGGYMTVLVTAATMTYLCVLKHMAARQVNILRENTEASRKENQVLYDAMGCWTSVAYFNNFEHELQRYKAAVALQLKVLFQYYIIRYAARTVQESILKVGFVAASFLAAYQVSTGKITVGGFVLLLNYWSRFTGEW
jgi:ABC-type bacteriocin/lantibiotic exporter with double-glycine peptidase domain